MKKFLLIPLLALMCCATAWARQITLGGTGANYSSLATLKTAIDNGSLQLSATDSIMLGANQTFAKNGVYDFHDATVICGTYRFTHSTGGGEITIKNVMLKDATNSGGAVNIQTTSATTVNFVNVKSNHNGITIGVTKTQPSTAPTINIDEDCIIAGNIWSTGTYSIQLYGSANINNSGQLTKYVAVHRHAEAQYEDAVVNINNEGTIDQGILADANQTVNLVNSGTLIQAVGNNGIFNLTNNGVATIYSNPTILPSGKNAQYHGTISFNGTENIDIIKNGEPETVFDIVPSGTNATIHRYCYFTAGTGDLAIEDGYYWRARDGRIMEADGIVASVFHAAISETENFEDLNDAFDAALSGDKITLEKDLNTSNPIWMGTTSINDTPRNLTLDLNGHTIRSASHVVETVILTHGALNIINSVPGQGGIFNENSSGVAVQVHGSYLQNCNPRTQTPFTHLTISEGVDIYATGSSGSGVAVYELDINERAYSQFGVDYLTNIYRKWVYKTSGGGYWKHEETGVANGVRVDINGHIAAKKYGFKVNGNIDFPDATKYGANTDVEKSRDSVAYWNGYVVSVADTAYTPYIYFGSTAVLEGDKNDASSAAVYASGYARYVVEGTLKGASGLYVRGGKVTVKNDANIRSSFEGSATFTPGSSTSGIATKGNAVVVNPKSGYPGHIEFYVEGDAKISTNATGGAALLEDVATPSMLESLVINGGQFTGPYSLAICEASQESGKVVVYGTTLTSEHVADVSGIVAAGVHTVAIPNNDGTTTVIISKGTSIPTEITNFGNTDTPQTGDVVLLPERADANWTGSEPGVINEGDAVVLGELQIISGTNSDKQELTIANNATLNVERLIMNENARIVVEAGGKLVVEGEQGINAPAAENIVLKSSETSQATFLINPEVTSNRHPMARVQLISKAYKRGENDYVWQRFGIPAYMDGITRGSMVYDHEAAPTAVYKLDYANNQWASMEDEDAFVPFRCYELTTTAVTPGAVYTFECPLMGNGDAELKLEGKWNYYANSYTAPIDIRQMISDFADQNPNVSATVYLYRASDNWWYEINNANLGETGIPTQIAPMQAFIFQRISEGDNPEVNYARQIWNPIMDPSANLAPARRSASSMKKAVIEITAADGTKDAIRLIEGANLSADFDNSYDAEKYMNTESFNLYADAQAPMAILATDDLEGTTLSMNTKEQTSFTMTISNVNAMDYAIRDNLTGTEIEMAEGATYMFSVPANTNVEGRFQIVPVAKMPTTIENIEATAAVKGIYTITGQFVGNDYHALPAGVYVVDGKKIVK